jgi:hypothetical protein
VAHQRGILEIKCFNDRRQIVGVAIHVVPGPGLTGSTMTTPVMGDHAKAILGEEMQLAVPGVGIQRPSV